MKGRDSVATYPNMPDLSYLTALHLSFLFESQITTSVHSGPRLTCTILWEAGHINIRMSPKFEL